MGRIVLSCLLSTFIFAVTVKAKDVIFGKHTLLILPLLSDNKVNDLDYVFYAKYSFSDFVASGGISVSHQHYVLNVIIHDGKF